MFPLIYIGGTDMFPPIYIGGTDMFPPIYIGGTDMFPPIAMEMQTGSTNKHISKIFFVLASPMYWWEMVSCTNNNSALAGGTVVSC